MVEESITKLFNSESIKVFLTKKTINPNQNKNLVQHGRRINHKVIRFKIHTNPPNNENYETQIRITRERRKTLLYEQKISIPLLVP